MLAKLNAVAAQDVDEKNSDLEAKIAAVASARANVARLNDLESFKRITAPFDGIVTSRATDIGALITVGAPNTTPLFTVADISKVRIYVSVPQDYSAEARPGLKATFTVPEFPARTFTATLMANAQAVSLQTGTVLVQLQAENSNHTLQAGDYAQVQFNLPPRASAFRLPASALIFKDSGTAVAIATSDGHVVIKPVTIARDFGTTVEVASGLLRSDRVIDNPPDSLKQGDRVRVAAASEN
jgi:RND family efflux transporter MFP subunit